jgi:hypothetical protein
MLLAHLALAIALILASFEAVAGVPPVPIRVELWYSPGCNGPPDTVQVAPVLPIGWCLPAVPPMNATINNAPVVLETFRLNCPASTLNYGVGVCNSTGIPLSSVCFQTGVSWSVKYSCLPDICKPSSTFPRGRCHDRLSQCNQWGLTMKW